MLRRDNRSLPPISTSLLDPPSLDGDFLPSFGFARLDARGDMGSPEATSLLNLRVTALGEVVSENDCRNMFLRDDLSLSLPSRRCIEPSEP